MVLKNNFLSYPQAPNFDDQIVPLNDIKYDIFSFGKQFEHLELSNNQTVNRFNHIFQVIDDELLIDKNINPSKKINDLTIIKHENLRTITTSLPKQLITVSNDVKADIKLSKKSFMSIIPVFSNKDRIINYKINNINENESTYFNGKLVEQLNTNFFVGDQVVIAGVVFELRPNQMKITEINGKFDFNTNALISENNVLEYPLEFPNFRRSPRIMHQEPTNKVTISQPESLEKEGKNDILKTLLPPLGMLAASFATSVLSGRNPLMMLGMGGASIITMGISISSYFTNKKESEVQKKEREKKYQLYTIDKTSEIKKLADKQRYSLDYHYPNMESLATLINEYNPRIYEKTSNNVDYLKFSLGTGKVNSSYKIDFNYDDQNKNDPLVKNVQETIVNEYQSLKDAPIITSLKEQTFGLVGSYPNLKNSVQTMLLQIATFHSYHDVQTLLLVPEGEYESDWKQWRWLPHLKMEELNIRGLVHNAQSRDMILNSFYQLLNKRKQQVKENEREKIQFSPHYILIILDDSWLAGHGLNEFLAEDMSKYGVTVVWGKEDTSMLPETVTTLIKYNSEESAQLVNENKVYVDKDFKPYKLPSNYELPQLISRLANLNHLEVEKNAIPETVTFLDMYNVKKIDELNIEDRWSKANTSKSLAVPLGLRGKDDLVYLNLHERAHGPHGLVAGTTGSGKSETVQSYLLSLAVNFAPEDVGFLPIDFKGGGMANLFAKLPHLLGSITNLDGASSARALASIRAELQKRQRLFGEFGVNHINGYTKLYKAGKNETNPDEKKKYPTKPMPHLFLVSDEFAELKANEPDFMAELVSTARIGRSLGVHLILATQKPSGVVDDQIWSNSRFKLALKVQDVADSNEILKTPDAASIVEPGRAYLQVGNNEIYELFQSAWSGADYDPNKNIEKKIDERMWLINDSGQAELLTEDLSADDDVVEVKNEDKKTQLDAIVDSIAEISNKTKAILPDKPWLPPLEKAIATPVINPKIEWSNERNLSVPIGLMDIPSRQVQEPLYFDFNEMNHTAIFASPGYGKSNFLQTLVMNLARKNTPEQVQFNLLDFGTNGLLPLEKLPHTADLARLNEKEKLFKMLQKMRSEIDKRKAEFQKAGVASLVQFEQNQYELPIIVNVLDGYDAVVEDDNRDEIDSVVSKILREGSAVGIYLIISANRSNSIKMSMMSNIETKLALFLVDESEVMDIIGRDRIIQQEIIGRGQIKLDQVNAFQTYLPNNETEPLSILNAINEEVAQLDAMWDGTRPEQLPIVPEEFDIDYFNTKVNDWQKTGNIALGLAISDTSPLGDIIEKNEFFVMSHTLDEQLEIQRSVLFNQLSHINSKKILIDFESEILNVSVFSEVINNEQDKINEIKQLMADYVKATQDNRELSKIYVYIADLESFLKESNFATDDLKLVLDKVYKSGMHIIIQSMESFIGKSYDLTVQAIRERAKSGIVSSRITDTGLIEAMGSSMEASIKNNEAYYFESRGRKYSKIRMAGEKG
ncbi:type VII secretion protein EssC [Companilactobacillus sp. DQM5]|uniref:type VII secretion protein EssC n=1 Tax=Companilactobacillus sp. DQM5 TaxID=3463359 RepID=UPI004058BEE4